MVAREIRCCVADAGRSEEGSREETRKRGCGNFSKHINLCFGPIGPRLVGGGGEAVCTGDGDL